MSHPLPDLMQVTLGKIREMVDANTVVGEPIVTPDGVTIIPISSVKIGFASGGSDFASKNATSANPFGGGAGAGVTVTPVAFLVIKEGNVRLLPVVEAASSTADRLLELLPDIAAKINELLAGMKKKKEKKAEKDAGTEISVEVEEA